MDFFRSGRGPCSHANERNERMEQTAHDGEESVARRRISIGHEASEDRSLVHDPLPPGDVSSSCMRWRDTMRARFIIADLGPGDLHDGESWILGKRGQPVEAKIDAAPPDY